MEIESTSDTLELDLGRPMDSANWIVLTQEQCDAIAARIEKAIAERKRVGRERRLRARLRQLQSLERAHERYQALQQS